MRELRKNFPIFYYKNTRKYHYRILLMLTEWPFQLLYDHEEMPCN